PTRGGRRLSCRDGCRLRCGRDGLGSDGLLRRALLRYSPLGSFLGCRFLRGLLRHQQLLLLIFLAFLVLFPFSHSDPPVAADQCHQAFSNHSRTSRAEPFRSVQSWPQISWPQISWPWIPWPRTARRPIEKLNRVHDRNRCAAGNLHHASDVARGNHDRLDACDVGELSIAQPCRKVRLEKVVGTSRTATQMTLRHIF